MSTLLPGCGPSSLASWWFTGSEQEEEAIYFHATGNRQDSVIQCEAVGPSHRLLQNEDLEGVASQTEGVVCCDQGALPIGCLRQRVSGL